MVENTVTVKKKKSNRGPILIYMSTATYLSKKLFFNMVADPTSWDKTWLLLLVIRALKFATLVHIPSQMTIMYPVSRKTLSYTARVNTLKPNCTCTALFLEA